MSNALIQVANLIAGLLTARVLGPKGRGELAAVLLWPQFLAYLLTLGVPIASVYHSSRNPGLAKTFSAIALLTSAIMGIVAAAVGLVIIPHSLTEYSPQIVHQAQLGVLTAPLALLGLTLSVQAQSAGAIRQYNLFRALPPLLIVLVLCCEVKFHFLNPFNAALAYLLAGVPITVWNFLWVWRHFKPSLGRSFAPVQTLFSYALRLWGSDLLGTVANQVDRVLVVSILSPSSVGLYVVAQSAVGLLNVVPSAFLPVLLPKASDRTTSEIVELVGRAARVTIVIMFVLGLPLFVFGDLALHLVYGDKFIGAAPVIRILLLEGILDGTTAVLTQAFLAAGIPGTVTLLQLCGLMSAVPLLGLLAPKWGVSGAAFAMLISTALRLSSVLFAFHFRLKVQPPNLLFQRKDWFLILGAKRRPAETAAF